MRKIIIAAALLVSVPAASQVRDTLPSGMHDSEFSEPLTVDRMIYVADPTWYYKERQKLLKEIRRCAFSVGRDPKATQELMEYLCGMGPKPSANSGQ